MPTGYEVQMYRSIERGADALVNIANTLTAIRPHIETIAQQAEVAVDLDEQKIQNVYDNVRDSFELAIVDALTGLGVLQPVVIDAVRDNILDTVADAVTNNFDTLTDSPGGGGGF